MSLYDAFIQDEKNRKYLALEEEKRRKQLLDNKSNREQYDDTLRKDALSKCNICENCVHKVICKFRKECEELQTVLYHRTFVLKLPFKTTIACQFHEKDTTIEDFMNEIENIENNKVNSYTTPSTGHISFKTIETDKCSITSSPETRNIKLTHQVGGLE